jgi:pimeloyl-ACP methyl ester carboxylesterase
MTLELISRRAAAAGGKPPLLFVHGAYTGAWCWDEYFLPWFARHGFDAHAVSLRGHGASPVVGALDLASLDDYVDDVAEAAARLEAPAVLVGHSMGAIVVQRAARRVAAPAIVLLAPVPPHGLSGSLFALASRDPPLFLAINSMQVANGGEPAGLARIRDYLFSQSVTETAARRHLMRMQRESTRALADLAWPQHFWIAPSVGLPALVIGAGRDAFFPAPMLEEAARFHGVQPIVFEAMAHAMMLEPGWRNVAACIRDWIATLG